MNLWTGSDIGLDLGDRTLFSGVHIHIPQGMRLRIAGPSGTGKSTFLRMLLGYLQPTSGCLLWNDQPFTPSVATEIRLKTAYMTQANPLAPEENPNTHFQRIANYQANRSPDGTYLDRAQMMMEHLGLDPSVCAQPCSELSGGERNRVILAGLLALDRSVVMLDEPTSGLDADNRERISSTIRQLPESTTVLLVSHDKEWDTNTMFQQTLKLT